MSTMLKLLLLLAILTVVSTLKIESDAANADNLLKEEKDVRDLLQHKIRKRGIFSEIMKFIKSQRKCASKKVSGTTDRFQVFTCPLIFGKKCRRKRGLFRSYVPYGPTHSYIRIGNTCYDWGAWNYPRHVSCGSSSIRCCTSRGKLKYTGTTNCAPRVPDFEAAWRATGRKYRLFTWNCQKFTDSMKDFLNKCCKSPGDAIKH